MNRVLRTLTVVVACASLGACETEPERNIAGIVTASRTSSFSEWSEPVSLGPAINGASNDQQAALSKDGLTLYFASNRPGTPGPGPNDIWVSQRACLECAWGEPVNVGAPVNTALNDAGPVLSRDEHWLFMLSDRPGGLGSSDIWVAWRNDVHDDFGWQTPVNLGVGVNSSGFEGGASYFENADGDGAQLYFNRNPAPVAGGGDIFVSTQNADGSYGTAVSVDELNSAGTDQRPAISHSGLEIYFFSNRAGGFGGVDIWGSTRESVLEPWAAPSNLGPVINTAVAEQHPFIWSRGGIEMLYFARNVGAPGAQNLDLFVSTRTRGGRN
jgi:hypothetical protein